MTTSSTNHKKIFKQLIITTFAYLLNVTGSSVVVEVN